MKPNNTYKINQIIDMLDSITERIDDIEKLLINKYSKVEDFPDIELREEKYNKEWTTAGLTEEEKEYKKEWVCQVCKKSTFETDYDYIVHPKLCLECALKEEMKGKDIKEQYHEASARMYKDFVVKEKQVDERMEENLKWYGNWKKDNLKNEG